jgi:hypothetical protein
LGGLTVGGAAGASGTDCLAIGVTVAATLFQSADSSGASRRAIVSAG